MFSSRRKELIGLIGCMDEANELPGEHGSQINDEIIQLYLGLAGSGLAKVGGGSQEGLPDKTRSLFAENQHLVIGGFKRMIERINGRLLVSSHAGCAWAGLQGIYDVVGATIQMCENVGVEYAGHIEYGNTPVKIGGTPVLASISRSPEEHRHVANSIISPIGGGITGEELYRFGKGDPFIINVDFAAEACNMGMPVDTAVKIVAAQLDKADGIMNGNIGVSKMNLFNAGRISSAHAKFNAKIFDLAVESLV